jgi:hypothetical protein
MGGSETDKTTEQNSHEQTVILSYIRGRLDIFYLQNDEMGGPNIEAK